MIVLIDHILHSTPPGDPVLLLAYERSMVGRIYSVLLASNERMHLKAKEKALKVSFESLALLKTNVIPFFYQFYWQFD